jgi:hypothetical protein
MAKYFMLVEARSYMKKEKTASTEQPIEFEGGAKKQLNEALKTID